MNACGWVYLAHLDRPLSPDHTCQHYLGWAVNPYERLDEHRAGQGARMLQVAVERQIDFRIVRLWPGDRKLERALKNRHAGPDLCPICANERRRQRWQLSFLNDMLLSFTLDDVQELRF